MTKSTTGVFWGEIRKLLYKLAMCEIVSQAAYHFARDPQHGFGFGGRYVCGNCSYANNYTANQHPRIFDPEPSESSCPELQYYYL